MGVVRISQYALRRSGAAHRRARADFPTRAKERTLRIRERENSPAFLKDGNEKEYLDIVRLCAPGYIAAGANEDLFNVPDGHKGERRPQSNPARAAHLHTHGDVSRKPLRRNWIFSEGVRNTHVAYGDVVTSAAAAVVWMRILNLVPNR
ncbi:hypothetical protein EVAR_62462_1 [Eumeta japonica]|uniref:Uncharacterized protein n=1 Tax=Eumeta variegata TaxID=151549 RepID=A0A4C1ZMJ2_EUMVA|nr:hypothetical protein EVAR_62462_1 [Eumeta japonica]